MATYFIEEYENTAATKTKKARDLHLSGTAVTAVVAGRSVSTALLSYHLTLSTKLLPGKYKYRPEDSNWELLLTPPSVTLLALFSSPSGGFSRNFRNTRKGFKPRLAMSTRMTRTPSLRFHISTVW